MESDTSTSSVQLSMAEISIRGISSSQEIDRSVGTPMNSGEIPSETTMEFVCVSPVMPQPSIGVIVLTSSYAF